MEIANSFLPLLQVFAGEMTTPSFNHFTTLVAGWVLAPRRTILGMLRVADSDHHHAVYHRLFSAARWSIDRVGLAVFDLMTSGADTVLLAGDDTLLGKTGLKVFGSGMHRDPMLSSRSLTVTRWGHCWVVLCVVIESPRVPGRYFSLPVMFRLYLNKKSAAKWHRTYYKKTKLMLEMLSRLQRHIGENEKTLHFLGDSAFTAPVVLNELPLKIDVTGRVVANARLREPPPLRTGKVGRPRKRGDRLPTPQEMLQQTGLPRLKIKLYENTEYSVRVAEQVCRFYKAPERDVKVIAIEHLRGGRGVEVFYTTDLDAAVETVLRRYSQRWSIEVTFHEVKQHLGIQEPQNRTTAAVRRTAPTGFLLYSLILWWHESVRESPARSLRWWPGKRGPSFAEMLAALRVECLEKYEQTHLSTPAIPAAVRKIIDQLRTLIQLAA